MKVHVAIDGCDDSTCFWIDVTEAERAFLDRLEDLVKDTALGNCQPEMTVGGEQCWICDDKAPDVDK